jgi:hypothetical protein
LNLEYKHRFMAIIVKLHNSLIPLETRFKKPFPHSCPILRQHGYCEHELR